MTAFAIESLRESRDSLADAGALAARAEQDGYLFFRGLLPVEAVAAAGERVRAACAERGFTAPGAKPVGYRDPAWVELQAELLPSPELAALADHAAIKSVLTAVMSSPPERAGAEIVRVTFSSAPELTTRPHQDSFYLRGSPDLWIAWVPLVDCPLDRGPLAVAPGSHRGGLRAHIGLELDTLCADVSDSDRWAASPLARGDVLMFSALTLHRALDNVSGELRLSVDFRYSPR